MLRDFWSWCYLQCLSNSREATYPLLNRQYRFSEHSFSQVGYWHFTQTDVILYSGTDIHVLNSTRITNASLKEFWDIQFYKVNTKFHAGHFNNSYPDLNIKQNEFIDYISNDFCYWRIKR